MNAVTEGNLDGLESIQKLTKDLKRSAVTLGRTEARFLVDAYYTMQKQRIRAGNQVGALAKSGEPHEIIDWFLAQNETLENQVKNALAAYAQGDPVGQWMLSVRGIGPVLSAGLLAHIDITKCPTVGHIWSFAGLDPTREWKKGEKRPWNGSLKTLSWKIGESFVKTKGHEEGYYGALYDQRKEYEQTKNAAGEYKEQAAEILKRTPSHKQAATYKDGKLPDGHIHARAKRYAVKQFYSDLHAFWYRHEFGTEPPLPYPIAILGHAHLRKP
jgi:hypothetical protein